MPNAILDTATYVDLQRARRFRNKAWAVNTMRHAASYRTAHGRLGLSPLGIMEITHGFNDELREQQLKDFHESILPLFQIVHFGVPESCLAGEIYAKLENSRQRIGIADTGIAATAILHGLSVITSNTKHFQRIIDLGFPLKYENWREA